MRKMAYVSSSAKLLEVDGVPLLEKYLDRQAMEKLSKAEDDDGFNFFERHPKKILGGAALAAGTGLYLLSRRKTPKVQPKTVLEEAKQATHPVAESLPTPSVPKARVEAVLPKSSPKAPAKPGKQVEVMLQGKPVKLTTERSEHDWVARGPNADKPRVEGYRRDSKAPVPRHPRGRHLNLQDASKMERPLEDEQVLLKKFGMARLASLGAMFYVGS
jgi:hypothetical protein